MSILAIRPRTLKCESIIPILLLVLESDDSKVEHPRSKDVPGLEELEAYQLSQRFLDLGHFC